MEYSYRFTYSLGRAFTNNYSVPGVISDNRILLEKNNVFSKMLVVDTSSDEIEVPIFVKPDIEDIIADKIEFGGDFNKIIVPLYTPYDTPISKRTIDATLDLFFRYAQFKNGLIPIVTPKGDLYYGNKGIILDSEYHPIIFFCLKGRAVVENEIIYMDYYKPVIYINPKLLLSPSSSIEKSILKKVVPYFLTRGIEHIYTSNSTFRNIGLRDNIPQIIIEDKSDLIISPIVPNPEECNSEVLNQVLIDNISDVLNNIE